MRPAPFRGNVIVWNLPEGFTGADLAALFDDHGLVLGATVRWWHDEPDRPGRGLVSLAPDRAVEKAVAALDGHQVGDRKLKVRRARPSTKPPEARAPKPPAAAPADAAAFAPMSTTKAVVVERRRLPRRPASP
jgi:hypothetical protein